MESGGSKVKSMLKESHMEYVKGYTKMVTRSKKDSSLIMICQAMADGSVIGLTILETGKMANDMALEQKSVIMAQPMWVPGKTT